MISFPLPPRWEAPQLDLPTKELDALILEEFESMIRSGTLGRLYLTWITIPIILITLFFMAPQLTKPLRIFSWTVVSTIYFYCYYNVHPRPGLLLIPYIGLSVGFYFRLSSLMLLETPQKDFKRLVRVGYRRQVHRNQSNAPRKPRSLPGSPPTTASPPIVDQKVQSQPSSSSSPSSPNCEDIPVYAWQSFPDDLSTRFWWVLDMVFNFRGVTWNWMPRGIAAVPSWVRNQFPPEDFQHSLTFSHEPPPLNTPAARDQHVISWFLNSLALTIITDLLVESVFYDAAFVGNKTTVAPEYFLSPPRWLLPIQPLLVNSTFVSGWRCLTAASLAVTHMACLFTICQFFFTILPELPFFLLRRLDRLGFPNTGVSGLIRSKLVKSGNYLKNLVGIYAEPWTIPGLLGPARGLKGRSSLQGFWGTFWQQAGRYGFTRPADEVIFKLGLSPSSTKGKFLRRFVSFLLSAFLHLILATQSANAPDPWKRMFMPFIWQFAGITIQEMLVTGCKSIGVPPLLRKIIDFAFGVAWIGWTCAPVVKYGIDSGALSNLQNMGFVRFVGIKPRSPGLLYGLLTRSVYWAPESSFVLTGLAI